MRADKPSLTAALVAGVRALYASFPSGLQAAPDPEALHLVPLILQLPAEFVKRVPLTASVLHHSVGAASLGLSWHVALRTLAIDEAAVSAAERGLRQVVLLGAGLDNRVGRLSSLQNMAAFEVDHPTMQREKKRRLANSTSAPHRHFVPVNFEVDKLDEALQKSGFDKDLPTFWIWEGVTPYLTRPAIESTLEVVGRHSAKTSQIALTYMRPPADLGRTVARLATAVAASIGEPVHAVFHREEMAQLLAGFGFCVHTDESDIDFAKRYWNPLPGATPPGFQMYPEWERLVIAEM
ncbi:MAG: SAM-dependent methyltransferase [Polyangiaceae bacterium]|nr:SAM-dependent methyltransferase [Polyangiaceae bacterium]